MVTTLPNYSITGSFRGLALGTVRPSKNTIRVFAHMVLGVIDNSLFLMCGLDTTILPPGDLLMSMNYVKNYHTRTARVGSKYL